MEGKQMQMGCKFHPSLISRQRKMISECCHFKTAMLAPLICVVMFLQFGECKSRIEPAEPAISEASTSKTTKLLPDSGKLVGQQYINYFFRFTYGVPGGLEIVPLQNNPAASRLFDRKNSFAL